ncbi:MAG TPA: hypothetical protein VJ550_12075 [Geomonas sp.]|nr:hypothetical protein [Geomonas sp.]
MLHIVQVVRWGVAEIPRIFSEEAKAQAAYVENVEKHWELRYAAYCEHHGLQKETFAAAQGFVTSIDVSEKSTVNLWSLPVEEAQLEASRLSGEGPEQAGQLASGMTAIKDGLARLLEDVSRLADGLAGIPPSPVVPVEVLQVENLRPSPPPPAQLHQAKPEADPAKYATKQWSVFVADIRRLCCGSRNESDLLPRGAWRDDVYSNATSLEYWDWVADRIECYKERAQAAGFTVIAVPDSSDYLKFTNGKGDTSEESYHSEWEAWCAAGLYLEKSQS